MKSVCSLCGSAVPLTSCGDGQVCNNCAATIRVGRDQATRQAKAVQRTQRLKADALRTVATGGSVDLAIEYDIASSDLMALDEPLQRPLMSAGGEVLPLDNPELCDTLATPGTVALDASRDRLELISQFGTDCTAMALDVSDTIQASNSLEKMLGHQLALTHKLSMDYASKAAMQADSANSVKMLNLSLRAMQTFQTGLMTLKKLRSTGEQRMTIAHVSVTDGGMAAFGQVHHRPT